MVIVWGSRLYGKVDEVPGLCYVSTKFLHLWYLPVIPLQSHLVFEESGGGWRSLPIGISLKSVGMAWLRSFLILCILGLALGGAVLWPHFRAEIPLFGSMMNGHGIMFLVAAVLSVVFALTKTSAVQQASYGRAEQLALLAGVPDGLFDMLKLIYGQVQTRREMAQIMARLDYAAAGQPLPGFNEVRGFDAMNELLPHPDETPAPMR